MSDLTNNTNNVLIRVSVLKNHITPSKQAVTRYKEIYEDLYQEELTGQQAAEQASSLLNFDRMVISLRHDQES